MRSPAVDLLLLQAVKSAEFLEGCAEPSFQHTLTEIVSLGRWLPRRDFCDALKRIAELCQSIETELLDLRLSESASHISARSLGC